MDGFLQMLELQAVLLVYLVVGVLCNKLGIITRANQQNFIDLVIYIFMPCMIFNSFKSITVEVLVSAFDVFLISMLVCLLSWAAGKVLYRRLPELQRRVAQYGTLISNAGFAGLPLAQQTFGDIGLIYGSVYLIPIRFFMWSAGVTMLSSERCSPATVAKKLATNPCVIAIFLGLARGFVGVEFPTPVETAISSLSACVSPLSMIVVGAIIGNVDPRTIFSGSVFYFCGIRLVALPLMAYGLCLVIGADATVAGVCLLLSSMPAAASTTLLSAQYGADVEFASKIVCMSTVLSLVTAPVLMLLL